MEKITKNSVYGEMNPNLYRDQICDFNEKMEMYRKNDLSLLKITLESILYASTTEESAKYRYSHSRAVAAISEDLAFEITKSPIVTNVQEYIIINEIFDLNDLWIFSMLGWIHDMYKYVETQKISHGKLASKQFSLYCKSVGIDMCGIVLQMKEALFFHSNKDMVISPNPFFSILCDADILAHITPFTMERYMSKGNLSQDNALKKIITDVSKYVPKTNPIGFNNIKDDLMKTLLTTIKVKRWLD